MFDKVNLILVSQALYGHTDAVTCLAVSGVHGVIASGSRDLTCILWDLEELNYITQLPGHKASITALAINDLTVSLHFLLPLSHHYLALSLSLFSLFFLPSQGQNPCANYQQHLRVDLFLYLLLYPSIAFLSTFYFSL